MRILVVEDERRIAQSLKKGFEQEHFAVDLAYDGLAGFDLGSSESYDVIIMDLMLPGMDGLALCHKLREHGLSVPIMMLTAKGQLSDKVIGLDSGADDYMTKPFAFSELVARIRALSRRPKQAINMQLKLSDLTLDSILYEVRRGGKLLPLSSKEFVLLEFFLRHPNQILTKNEIISHVWNYDADILENTVEVQIRNLRKKIEAPFKNSPRLIHTVRGFGYKLVGE